MSTSLPYDDSRRLTGWNLHFADVGAVLETCGIGVDDALLDGWRARVRRARVALGWPDAALVVRRHAGGASLALAAPVDQLLAATEVDEWALLSTLGDAVAVRFHAPGHPAAWDEPAALATLRAFAAAEHNPRLGALVHAAHARGLEALLDDDTLTLGSGRHAATFALHALPDVAGVDWDSLRNVPVALVTGSNGKTTTTRLLAAMLRAHGLHVAHTCTDGVFVGDEMLASGDYSGPGGARTALRAPGVDFAVLETARGGLLRRGLAVCRADVAVVTNISADHFGEYGVHDLADLAAVKLSVARALGADGTLVLNADDALLVDKGRECGTARTAWFSLDADADVLVAQRAAGASTCGLRQARLVLHAAGVDHDLGAVAAMPLTFGGAARYNIANLAAAALAAHALGVTAATIAAVAAGFGASRKDNPGRLQHLELGGVSIVVDYAHNPEGMQGLLDVVAQLRQRRLGLMLGQAGNRGDVEIRELAAVVARFHPERVVLKDIGGMLRGRESGEVADMMLDELRRRGLPADAITRQLDEYAAVVELLAWARAGDVLVLPVHGVAVKSRVAALLESLHAGGWQAGRPFDARLTPADAAVS